MSQHYKIIVVGTQPSKGRGGISTALEGYLEGLDLIAQEYCFVSSHHDRQVKLSIFRTWFIALTEVFKLTRQAKKENKRCIVWLHAGAWISLFRKFTIALIARLAGAKVVIHIHSQSNLNYLATPSKSMLFKLMLAPANKLFILTSWWQCKFAEHYSPSKLSIIPNPVNQKLLNVLLDSEKERDDSKFDKAVKIITMSRLVPGKGFEELINAMPLLDEKYTLQVAGDGPLMQALQEQVVRLKLDKRVTFLGWLNAEKKIELLSAGDVFCLPSKNDSFGMVYLEAMAAKIPVVALNFGAIPDVVKHRYSGILCEDNQANNLVKGISLAIANHKKLVHGGVTTIQTKYSPIVVAEMVTKVMASLL